jgi:hypothetical protein
MKPLHRFRHYVGLERAAAKLAAVLREFRFTSIATAFAQVRPARAACAPRLAS